MRPAAAALTHSHSRTYTVTHTHGQRLFVLPVGARGVVQNECTSRFALIEGCQARPEEASQREAWRGEASRVEAMPYIYFLPDCAAAAAPVVTD